MPTLEDVFTNSCWSRDISQHTHARRTLSQRADCDDRQWSEISRADPRASGRPSVTSPKRRRLHHSQNPTDSQRPRPERQSEARERDSVSRPRMKNPSEALSLARSHVTSGGGEADEGEEGDEDEEKETRHASGKSPKSPKSIVVRIETGFFESETGSASLSLSLSLRGPRGVSSLHTRLTVFFAA